MRILEDGKKLVGDGTIESVFNSIIAIGYGENPDFDYDFNRLSIHPEDYREEALTKRVPEFANTLLAKIAPRGSTEDKDLQILLACVGGQYLSRHDTEWYHENIETPIESLLGELAKAQNSTITELIRGVAAESAKQIKAKIFAMSTLKHTQLLIMQCDTNEKVDGVLAQQKEVAHTIATKLGIEL